MERYRSPVYAQMELTFACNLACLHCYNEPRFSQREGKVILNKVKKEQGSYRQTLTYLSILKDIEYNIVLLGNPQQLAGNFKQTEIEGIFPLI